MFLEESAKVKKHNTLRQAGNDLHNAAEGAPSELPEPTTYLGDQKAANFREDTAASR